MSDITLPDLETDIRSQFCADLIGAMPEPAVIVGADMRLITANAPAQTLLTAAKVGEPLVLALRAPDVLDGLRRVLAQGRTETVSWSERVPVERVFDVHIAPLTARDGEIGAALITLRDLTEARKVERMRVDFIANASHELRTPLASLLGFVETLQGPARDDERARQKFLSIMREQGRRMARLVDDLLSLSRIEQNQHVRPETPVDLALVARHVADTLAPLATEMGVDLDVQAGRSVIVMGDRDELVRVAENLVENAIKYGAPSPSPENEAQRGGVEIRVARFKREGLLSVRDDGPGIAPEHLPRLTERFYRIDAGQSRSRGGTGLGLAIVKHIIARHRGRLTISSDIGRGSTFVALIPLHPNDFAPKS
jgi:two-component system, OmpR family, phosphate regulon sensor histidine kinase PhoR